MLRSLIGESPKQWDRVLAQAEFSYNDSLNRSIGMSPFQILYGMHLRGVSELLDLGQLEKGVLMEKSLQQGSTNYRSK